MSKYNLNIFKHFYVLHLVNLLNNFNNHLANVNSRYQPKFLYWFFLCFNIIYHIFKFIIIYYVLQTTDKHSND